MLKGPLSGKMIFLQFVLLLLMFQLPLKLSSFFINKKTITLVKFQRSFYVTMEPFQDSFRWKYGLQPLEYDDAGKVVSAYCKFCRSATLTDSSVHSSDKDEQGTPLKKRSFNFK
jgi:hypothetical protein